MRQSKTWPTAANILAICLSLLAASCGRQAPQSASPWEAGRTIRVVLPRSPAAIPFLAAKESGSADLSFSFYSDMEQMTALASGNEWDFLVVPVHTASTLKNRGFDIRLLSVFGWGGMYLSSTDPEFSGWADLEGRKLFVPARGSVPDLLARCFLSQSGLEAGRDVEIVYSNHAEIAQLLAAGKAVYAVDAEPFATANTKNLPGYRVVSDFAEDWTRGSGKGLGLPSNCLVARVQFLEAHPQETKRVFSALESGITAAAEDTERAGFLAQEYLGANALLIQNAFPRFNLKSVSGKTAADAVTRYCEILLKLKPESVGGRLPGEFFYYGTPK